MPFIACLNNVKTTHTPHPTITRRGMPKKLAKTQKLHTSTTNPTTHRNEYTEPIMKNARVHYADLKQQPHQHPHPHHVDMQAKGGPEQPPNPGHPRHTADSSGPNSVQICPPLRDERVDDSTNEHHHTRRNIRPASGHVLLRKEVIQPHLPVRLPCYDFVPIASPTFDSSLRVNGWATGFGCCRLS